MEEKNLESVSTTKYYFTKVATGIKKFTQTMCMKSIVNGFISAMPVIIVASIFTLLTALPEMVMSVMYSGQTVDVVINGTLETISKMDWFKMYTAFGDFQYWGGNISNWSMGVLGVYVTVAISRNMGVFLNEKLPFERRINEMTLIFAAISTYLMLSVVEFSLSADVISGIPDYYIDGNSYRAIFVDGLAAQGILPGVLIALTMPWFFYWAMKYNWTIRLPKQVPQTISQAFLAIIPLFIVLFVYGSIAFAFNMMLGMPFLFWLFTLIQQGLTANPDINNSYGLIAIYTIMEGGFWFLGVHPEPVHAIMRSTFWFENIANNATGANNIFVEPYMYGYGAMGGSGATLAVPFLCLLFCRSDQLKIVGKTGSIPILFQVNEPTLFGVPTILNPLFFIPMIFTGMINDMLFKALADGTNFMAGSLYLPWSTPFFLQTALGTPTQWQPWVFNAIALSICFGMYAPFVMIQDKIYVNEQMKKQTLGKGQFKLAPNGVDIIKERFFFIDFETKAEDDLTKLSRKNELIKLKDNGASKLEIKNVKAQWKLEDKLLKNINNNKKLVNLTKWSDEYFGAKLIKIQNSTSSTDTIQMLLKEKTTKKQNKIDKSISKKEQYLAASKTFEQIRQNYTTKKLEKKQEKQHFEKSLFYKFYTNRINKLLLKSKKCDEKIKIISDKKISLSIRKDPDVKKIWKEFKVNKQWKKFKYKLIKHCLARDEKIKSKFAKDQLQYVPLVCNFEKKYYSKQEIVNEIKKEEADAQTKAVQVKQSNADKLSQGINPWAISTKSSELKLKKIDVNKTFKVLVLCLGAGSSAVLANAINEGLKKKGIDNIVASALAWGTHEASLPTVDLVILSPQMGANAKSLDKASQELGFKFIATRGKEYIDLSRSPEKASDLVLEKLGIENEIKK